MTPGSVVYLMCLCVVLGLYLTPPTTAQRLRYIVPNIEDIYAKQLDKEPDVPKHKRKYTIHFDIEHVAYGTSQDDTSVNVLIYMVGSYGTIANTLRAKYGKNTIKGLANNPGKIILMENYNIYGDYIYVYNVLRFQYIDDYHVFTCPSTTQGSKCRIRADDIECIKGWDPYIYCSTVRYNYMVKSAYPTGVTPCDKYTFNFRITFIGIQGRFDVTSKAIADLTTVTAENIGKLQTVWVERKSSCRSNRMLLQVELITNTDRYVAYGKVNPRENGRQKLGMIRVSCRHGSQEYVCNHLEYTYRIRLRRGKTDGTFRIDIRGSKGSATINKRRAKGKDTDGSWYGHNLGVIDEMFLTNDNDYSVSIDIEVSSRYREESWSCDNVKAYSRKASCESTMTVCNVGAPKTPRCEYVYYSIDVYFWWISYLSRGAKSVLLVIYGIDSYEVLRVAVPSTRDWSTRHVGGEYYMKDVGDIEYMHVVTDTTSSGLRMGNITKCNQRYDLVLSGKPSKGENVIIYKLTDTESKNPICVTEWAPTQGCKYTQVVVALHPPLDTNTDNICFVDEFNGTFPIAMSYESDLTSNTLPYEEHVNGVYILVTIFTTRASGTCVRFVTLKYIGYINKVMLRNTGKTDFQLSYVIIDDGRTVYRFNRNRKLRAKSQTPTYIDKNTETVCFPGYKGSKCDIACGAYSRGVGCTACQCNGGSDCDRVTGFCNKEGECTARYFSPYCDWTCPRGLIDDSCLREDSSSAPCTDYNDVCPERCSKDERGCIKKCTQNYGRGCRKPCRCLNDETCNGNTGKCTTCDYRYYGNDCQRKCEDGKHVRGNDKTTCDVTCHCANPLECHAVVGCLRGGCADGWGNPQLCDKTCNFGKKCPGSCGHCRNGAECDTESGECPNDCDDRYYGKTCKKYCQAGMFVDNDVCDKMCHCRDNRNCALNGGSCAGAGGCDVRHTGQGCQDTCRSASFHDSNRRCARTCRCKFAARCNVATGVCESGGCESARWSGNDCQTECNYGTYCKQPCHCLNKAKCNEQTGACPQGKCDYRYHGSDCQQRCPARSFISSNGGCSKTCHCLNNLKCFAATGRCESGGCDRGWMGQTCQIQCTGRKFGLGCSQTCHCLNNGNCDPVTGICFAGCRTRKYGAGCLLTCTDGKYVIDNICKGQCRCADQTNCQVDTGHCVKCATGYKGHPKCQDECDGKAWGDGCGRQCHCKGGEQCHHVSGVCKSGCGIRRYGPGCDNTCSTGKFADSLTGECTRVCPCKQVEYCQASTGACIQGGCSETALVQGDKCKAPCQTGRYGDGCRNVCHCASDNDCNMFTGHCEFGCDVRYYGDSCQKKCEEGKYEPKGGVCVRDCHCDIPPQCSAVDGKCLSGECAKGWKGDICQTPCEKGMHGKNCADKCGCKNPGVCNGVTGECADGNCLPRYYGARCTKTCRNFRYVSDGACNGTCYCTDQSMCSVSNGSCVSGGCVGGRRGRRCENDCYNRFGPICEFQCHCSDDGSCDRDTGKCEYGCATRYTGEACQDTCDPGFYDHAGGCLKKCNCLNADKCKVEKGYCADNKCKSPRFTGFSCEEPCEDGLYIVSGNCSGECKCNTESECYVSSGSCRRGGCLAGLHGIACQTPCGPGSFGSDCKKTCHCKFDESCDIVSGRCKSGCAEGRIGVDCQGLLQATKFDFIWAIAAGLVLLSIIFGLVYSKSRQNKGHVLVMGESELGWADEMYNNDDDVYNTYSSQNQESIYGDPSVTRSRTSMDNLDTRARSRTSMDNLDSRARSRTSMDNLDTRARSRTSMDNLDSRARSRTSMDNLDSRARSRTSMDNLDSRARSRTSMDNVDPDITENPSSTYVRSSSRSSRRRSRRRSGNSSHTDDVTHSHSKRSSKRRRSSRSNSDRTLSDNSQTRQDYDASSKKRRRRRSKRSHSPKTSGSGSNVSLVGDLEPKKSNSGFELDNVPSILKVSDHDLSVKASSDGSKPTYFSGPRM